MRPRFLRWKSTIAEFRRFSYWFEQHTLHTINNMSPDNSNDHTKVCISQKRIINWFISWIKSLTFCSVLQRERSNSNDDHHPDDKQFEVTRPKTSNNCEDQTTLEIIKRNEVLRKLKLASYICFTFFLVEVTGGFLAGSLAVLSDAVHLAADLSAFVLAIAGSHIAGRPASGSHTFGLRRAESLAALLSMAFLVILSIGLAGEALLRICELSFSEENVTQVNG